MIYSDVSYNRGVLSWPILVMEIVIGATIIVELNLNDQKGFYGYCGAHLNDQKRILSSANGHESVTATEH